MAFREYALIVAGGTGTRMGADLPKQFLNLAGKPVLMHTIEKFFLASKSLKILLVLPENQLEPWQVLIRKFNFQIPHQVVIGGQTRFQSVKNGLATITDSEGLVAIHDGVRPLIHPKIILKTFESARAFGSGVVYVPLKDSIRKIESDQTSRALNRSGYILMQTPQTFHLQAIKKAFELPESDTFTDDATVFEALGKSVSLVEGHYANIKITTPEDLFLAEALHAYLRENVSD